MVRIGRETDKKTVTADPDRDTEIPLGSGCRLVYICNAILITLSILTLITLQYRQIQYESVDEIDETEIPLMKLTKPVMTRAGGNLG